MAAGSANQSCCLFWRTASVWRSRRTSGDTSSVLEDDGMVACAGRNLQVTTAAMTTIAIQTPTAPPHPIEFSTESYAGFDKRCHRHPAAVALLSTAATVGTRQ